MDVADLAVEGFVLQARPLQSGGAAVLQLGPRPRVGFDRAGAAPGLQHRLVLGTWAPMLTNRMVFNMAGLTARHSTKSTAS